jgi:hypothetical protein
VNFNQLHLHLLNARSAEQAYPGASCAADIHKADRDYKRTVHPDRNPNNLADAEAAYKLVTEWSRRAHAKLEAGTWGDGRPHVTATFTTKLGTYRAYHLLRRDAVMDVIAAALDDTEVELHMPRLPRDSVAASAAAESLVALSGGACAPTLIEKLRIGTRIANTISCPPPRLESLATHFAHFPDGVQARAAIVYFDGLLEALNVVGRAGRVHGSINPITCMVTPMPYRHYLTDWHYSVPRGGAVARINDTYREFCSWEVLDDKPRPTDAGTDLASAFKLLQWMLGTHDVPDALRAMIAEHLREGRARPHDIPACRQRLRKILTSL